MSGGGSDTSDPPVPPGSDRDEGDVGDEFLTSGDLFADMVDEPLPPRERAEAVRKDPIRVQVSDPMTPGPFAAVQGDEPEPPAEATEAPAQTPCSSPPSDEVDDAFSRIGGLVAESIFRPALPVVDDEEARLPPAAVRTGAKLSITDPKILSGRGWTSRPWPRTRSRRRPASRRRSRGGRPPRRRASPRGGTTASGRISSSTGWRSVAWPRSSRPSAAGSRASRRSWP